MTPEEAYATCHAVIVYVTSKLASLPEICDPEKHRAALRDRYDLDVLANKDRHCSNCGQKIDWSEFSHV